MGGGETEGKKMEREKGNTAMIIVEVVMAVVVVKDHCYHEVTNHRIPSCRWRT